jgi:hypothetical protein
LSGGHVGFLIGIRRGRELRRQIDYMYVLQCRKHISKSTNLRYRSRESQKV